ncbi:hypothetical protein [Maridesulfovibrio ferrireducens]|uniref:hypothetical protein n=1 Tax=Maridesulfovibrio ferrireducens TaxID=246191 RepID=UPI001A31FEF4|nr:hypothetical protein [Maridesulfovibrio ferrireducens]MBI9110718.1 hypothetical protein [Maridesulfovibrio ferrireducens]
MQKKTVDVIINVFGKPHQTALSLLSLLEQSGQHVNKIYFQEEPCTSEFEKNDHTKIIQFLNDKIIYFKPKYWNGIEPTDIEKLSTDRDYLLSMRYQHGWENSKSEYILTIHNDIDVKADVAGNLLSVIGDNVGAGEVGQCWWCPAFQNGLCDSSRYMSFKPSYSYLMKIYNKNFDPKKRRAYCLGLSDQFHENAWPLPECRLNEWCALINIDKARKETMPFGKAAPIGALISSGAFIGENRDQPVCLDTGVQWFRDMVLAGYSFANYDVNQDIDHDRRGNAALGAPELYVKAEIVALHKIKDRYPEFYNFYIS